MKLVHMCVNKNTAYVHDAVPLLLDDRVLSDVMRAVEDYTQKYASMYTHSVGDREGR